MPAVEPDKFKPMAGKGVLVTGAGSGIGKAVAIAFAEAGASVSLCGRREGLLEETAAIAGQNHVPVRVRALDVADETAVQAWVDDALAAFGRLDVLANCAGTNAPRRSWANTPLDSWHELIATNLTGVFLCTRAVLPTMRAQRDGLIINISSIAGVQPSTVSGVAYGASKFGVMSLTGMVNLEEWSNGIRATVVCPGEVATPIMDKRPNPPPARAFPLMIQPEDLGATLVFLATLPPRVVVEEIRIRPTVRAF
ncbi:MAG TPA: SDR family oxidoreductase [Chloroflexota bacterium]|nr:SDR family oxidoreductase [Chloroflexota bacterium]